jgi:hypothetical protein
MSSYDNSSLLLSGKESARVVRNVKIGREPPQGMERDLEIASVASGIIIPGNIPE